MFNHIIAGRLRNTCNFISNLINTWYAWLAGWLARGISASVHLFPDMQTRHRLAESLYVREGVNTYTYFSTRDSRDGQGHRFKVLERRIQGGELTPNTYTYHLFLEAWFWL